MPLYPHSLHLELCGVLAVGAVFGRMVECWQLVRWWWFGGVLAVL